MDTGTKIFNKIARSHMYWGRKPLAGLNDALKYVQEGEVVLDPLCGGGTVEIAALQRGAKIIACDLNPVAIFLTTTLLRPINIAKLIDGFKEAEFKVKSKILNRYLIACPQCRKQSIIDYIIWEDEKPKRAKISCSNCKNRNLQILPSNRIKKQIELSNEQPKLWYPKTHIESIRSTSVVCHYQLFTGRNLSCLADLFQAIGETKEENCKDALLYVFTALLYSVSKMQMFSE